MPQLNSLAKVSSEEQRSGIIRMPGCIIMTLLVIWEAEKILVFRGRVFYVRTEPGNLGAWLSRAAGRELSSTILVFRGRVFYVRTEPGNPGAWLTRAAGRELSSTILVLCVFICLEERKDDL